MAITVQSLYNSLNVYRLKLIAGANGLQKHVSWVYYTEDPESIEFIRGGEIEITTGLNVERHKHNTDDKSDFSLEFLTALIKESVDKNASGLIVNTGKYIDVIPQKIISLCDELDFPLFTMPWEIHTIDVMQEIGNKIVNDNQKGQTLEQCFYDVLFHSKNFNSAYLENTSFANASEFSIILMKIPSGLFDDGNMDVVCMILWLWAFMQIFGTGKRRTLWNYFKANVLMYTMVVLITILLSLIVSLGWSLIDRESNPFIKIKNEIENGGIIQQIDSLKQGNDTIILNIGDMKIDLSDDGIESD